MDCVQYPQALTYYKKELEACCKTAIEVSDAHMLYLHVVPRCVLWEGTRDGKFQGTPSTNYPR